MRTFTWLGVNFVFWLPALLVAVTFLRRRFLAVHGPAPAAPAAAAAAGAAGAAGAPAASAATPPGVAPPPRARASSRHRDLVVVCVAGVGLALGGFALSVLPAPAGNAMPFMGLLAASAILGLFTARAVLRAPAAGLPASTAFPAALFVAATVGLALLWPGARGTESVLSLGGIGVLGVVGLFLRRALLLRAGATGGARPADVAGASAVLVSSLALLPLALAVALSACRRADAEDPVVALALTGSPLLLAAFLVTRLVRARHTPLGAWTPLPAGLLTFEGLLGAAAEPCAYASVPLWAVVLAAWIGVGALRAAAALAPSRRWAIAHGSVLCVCVLVLCVGGGWGFGTGRALVLDPVHPDDLAAADSFLPFAERAPGFLTGFLLALRVPLRVFSAGQDWRYGGDARAEILEKVAQLRAAGWSENEEVLKQAMLRAYLRNEVMAGGGSGGEPAYVRGRGKLVDRPW